MAQYDTNSTVYVLVAVFGAPTIREFGEAYLISVEIAFTSVVVAQAFHQTRVIRKQSVKYQTSKGIAYKEQLDTNQRISGIYGVPESDSIQPVQGGSLAPFRKTKKSNNIGVNRHNTPAYRHSIVSVLVSAGDEKSSVVSCDGDCDGDEECPLPRILFVDSTAIAMNWVDSDNHRFLYVFAKSVDEVIIFRGIFWLCVKNSHVSVF
eukprot:gene1468-2825_t